MLVQKIVESLVLYFGPGTLVVLDAGDGSPARRLLTVMLSFIVTTVASVSDINTKLAALDWESVLVQANSSVTFSGYQFSAVSQGALANTTLSPSPQPSVQSVNFQGRIWATAAREAHGTAKTSNEVGDIALVLMGLVLFLSLVFVIYVGATHHVRGTALLPPPYEYVAGDVAYSGFCVSHREGEVVNSGYEAAYGGVEAAYGGVEAAHGDFDTNAMRYANAVVFDTRGCVCDCPHTHVQSSSGRL